MAYVNHVTTTNRNNNYHAAYKRNANVRRRKKKHTIKRALYKATYNTLLWIDKNIKKIAFVAVMIAVVVISSFITLKIDEYKDNHTMRDYGRTKYYMEYYVYAGDTLWDIGESMLVENPEYPTVAMYVNDIIETNDLSYSGKITSGNYILIPFYD